MTNVKTIVPRICKPLQYCRICKNTYKNMLTQPDDLWWANIYMKIRHNYFKLVLNSFVLVISTLGPFNWHGLTQIRTSVSNYANAFVWDVIIHPCHNFNVSPKCRIYASMSRVSFGYDYGLSPIRHQAIILTNAGLLSIEPLGTSFSEILIKIQKKII